MNSSTSTGRIVRRLPVAAAQLRFGGRPLGAAVAAERHQPVPRLDHLPERLEVVGLADGVERLVELGVEAIAVGIGQGGPDPRCPLGEVRPLTRSATLMVPIPPGRGRASVAGP